MIEKDTKQPKLTRNTPSAPKQSFPPLQPFNPVVSTFNILHFKPMASYGNNMPNENCFRLDGTLSSVPYVYMRCTEEFLLIELPTSKNVQLTKVDRLASVQFRIYKLIVAYSTLVIEQFHHQCIQDVHFEFLNILLISNS